MCSAAMVSRRPGSGNDVWFSTRVPLRDADAKGATWLVDGRRRNRVYSLGASEAPRNVPAGR